MAEAAELEMSRHSLETEASTGQWDCGRGLIAA